MRPRDHRILVLINLTLLIIMTKITETSSNRETSYHSPVSEKQILDDLLHRPKYDKRLRPPGISDEEGIEGIAHPMGSESKCTNATIVFIHVVVLSLSSPDESSFKYEIEFLLHQQWNDTRLDFAKNYSFDYVNGIHHHEDIWRPDTHFIKHGEYNEHQKSGTSSLRIYKNGLVEYVFRRRLSLACEGDVHIFPFDNPKCAFAMESISHEKNELEYRWQEKGKKPALHFLPEMHSLNAYIEKNETNDNCSERLAWRDNYSCLRVHLVFTRDKSFYFSTVFIPGMLLVTSSFITFWLEWNAVPGRVMLGVTTMLNFFTTSNNFRSNLPVVSDLTAMNVWDGVCMCFIYASLLEFVSVNYLGRKKPRSLRCYRTVNTTVSVKQNLKGEPVGNHENFSCATCPPNQCTHVDKLPPPKHAPPPPPPNQDSSPKVPYFDFAHPLRVAKTIDVVSRVVFPVAYGVFLIFFFARYNGFS